MRFSRTLEWSYGFTSRYRFRARLWGLLAIDEMKRLVSPSLSIFCKHTKKEQLVQQYTLIYFYCYSNKTITYMEDWRPGIVCHIFHVLPLQLGQSSVFIHCTINSFAFHVKNEVLSSRLLLPGYELCVGLVSDESRFC